MGAVSELESVGWPHVEVYVDGACSGNPGPGGWGAVLIFREMRKEMSGFEPHTTNNRMELTAAIAALDALKTQCCVKLYTDSQYVQRGMSELLKSWKVSGKLDSGKVANADLWLRLDAAASRHVVDWIWVRGHSGVPGNMLADRLARAAIRQAMKTAMVPA